MSTGDFWLSGSLAATRAAWDVSPTLIVITLGPEHRLAYQNPASTRLFGARPIGAVVEEAFPEMSPSARATLDGVLGGSGPLAEPVPRPGVLGAAGEEIQLTYVFAPLAEPGHAPWGVLLTAIDVTAEVHAQRSALQSALLGEMSERMNDAADPTEALEVLTQTLVPAVADVAAVYVTDLDRDRYRSRSTATARRPRSAPSAMSISPRLLAAVGDPPQATAESRPSPWESALAAGRPVLIDIAGGDLVGQSADAMTSWLRRARAQNMAVLPLSLAGELAGAVVLLSAGARPAYDPGDLTFLELIAARAGSAVSHLRVYREQRQIAFDLQHALLPAVPTALPGLAAAARYLVGGTGVEIGGDWWDIHQLREHHVGVGLGDVAGRGIPAAIVMGHARAAMRAAATAELSPGAILTLLDGQLADLINGPEPLGRNDIPARFATAVYADLDLESRTARVANAGHLPLFSRAPDGRVHRIHAPTGTPLGLRFGHYEEIVVPFAAGTVLVGFTDGLVETRDCSLDVGLAEVEHYLDALDTADVDQIADGLLEHMSRTRTLQDDVALVVLHSLTS